MKSKINKAERIKELCYKLVQALNSHEEFVPVLAAEINEGKTYKLNEMMAPTCHCRKGTCDGKYGHDMPAWFIRDSGALKPASLLRRYASSAK